METSMETSNSPNASYQRISNALSLGRREPGAWNILPASEVRSSAYRTKKQVGYSFKVERDPALLYVLAKTIPFLHTKKSAETN